MAPPTQKIKPRVPPGFRIYAIGDVHGRADLLDALFDRIDMSLQRFPVTQAVHVLLGDYIDRGPNSREVIDTLIARNSRHAMVFLKGNHESLALQVLRDPAVLSEWGQMGGFQTLLSYGIKPPSRTDTQSEATISAAFKVALPASHRAFLEQLKLSFTLGDYFFSHAGIRPGVPLDQQREHDLLWIRDDFLLHEEDFGKMVVHGHSPVVEPDVRSNRIDIDTGAYATGRLTCLILQEDRMAFI